jgi:hypothetical protein
MQMSKLGIFFGVIFFVLGILEILHIRALTFDKPVKQAWQDYKNSFKLFSKVKKDTEVQ